MRIPKKVRRVLTAMAVVLPLVTGVSALSAPAAVAAGPDPLPLTVTNNSNRSDAVYLYVLGTNLSTGKLGYVDAGGAFTPWPPGANPPSPAPDVAIGGPGNGGSTTIRIPRMLSGRVYMSFGQKIKFFLTPDGLVQPAPWADGDPNRDTLFDWSEFTYDNGGLFINSSQVDMFSVPHAVGLTNGAGENKEAGRLKDNGRENIFNAVQGQAGFSNLAYNRLRVLAPGKGLETGKFSGNYLDGYVTRAWDAYKSTPLTVVPFEADPGTKFTGKTGDDNVMRFTSTSGATVASFDKPSTRDVFNCDGKLQAPNDQTVGPIARTLCAALHRSTLGTLHTQPTYDAGQFYKESVTDHYSRIVHEQMVDGKAYGFAFDDVGHFESLVHDGDPRTARITLTAF
ncbi:beta-1,3-glucanase family protein [Amycolatopsis pittospori]|uniref:beta-1,3-glucanase family protein n=1 Tax=Amycolatopsis pittospori TaxID=2749434 RepID=UPI0015F0BCE3|nr:beta-1,3-glucanase family protein [Amycolatopsis pittospori]